ERWQGLAGRHGLADTVEAPGHRLAVAVEKVAPQVLPAAHAADDLLRRHRLDPPVQAGGDAPRGGGLPIQALDPPVPPPPAPPPEPPGAAQPHPPPPRHAQSIV